MVRRKRNVVSRNTYRNKIEQLCCNVSTLMLAKKATDTATDSATDTATDSATDTATYTATDTDTATVQINNHNFG